MAILIKGMEMPKHDDEYVIFTVYGDGGVVYGPLNRPHVRYKNRAVSVPEPHGRLIDTGSWTFPTLHRNPSNDYMHGWNACLKSVLQQPAIIPASGVGK